MKRFLVMFVAIAVAFAFFGCAEGDGTNLNRPAYVAPTPSAVTCVPIDLTGVFVPNATEGTNKARIFTIDSATGEVTINWSASTGYGATDLGPNDLFNDSAIFSYALPVSDLEALMPYGVTFLDYVSEGWSIQLDVTTTNFPGLPGQPLTARNNQGWTATTLSYPTINADNSVAASEMTFALQDFADYYIGFQLSATKPDIFMATFTITGIHLVP